MEKRRFDPDKRPRGAAQIDEEIEKGTRRGCIGCYNGCLIPLTGLVVAGYFGRELLMGDKSSLSPELSIFFGLVGFLAILYGLRQLK